MSVVERLFCRMCWVLHNMRNENENIFFSATPRKRNQQKHTQNNQVIPWSFVGLNKIQSTLRNQTKSACQQVIYIKRFFYRMYGKRTMKPAWQRSINHLWSRSPHKSPLEIENGQSIRKEHTFNCDLTLLPECQIFWSLKIMERW